MRIRNASRNQFKTYYIELFIFEEMCNIYGYLLCEGMGRVWPGQYGEVWRQSANSPQQEHRTEAVVRNSGLCSCYSSLGDEFYICVKQNVESAHSTVLSEMNFSFSYIKISSVPEC